MIIAARNQWRFGRLLSCQINSQFYGTATSSSETLDLNQILKKEKTSKAMKAYLERARAHDEFMKTQKHEFEVGKRHLANMMGEPAEHFENQENIDEAIRYLFPSALYDQRAKPMMKPPEEVFPQRKAAEFDETGRPYHPFFYTSKPNFFKFLHDIVSNQLECNKFEDRMIRQQKTPDPALQLNLTGSTWLTKDQLELKLVENIRDIEYNNFVSAMTRLANNPYSYRCKDFIDQYRRPLVDQNITVDIPKPQIDQDGRSFITVYECLRKRARGDVTVRSPGKGKVTINGQPITYFDYDQAREQVSEFAPK